MLIWDNMVNASNNLLATKNDMSLKLHSRSRRHKQYITNEIEIDCFRPIGLSFDPDTNCHFIRHNYFCNFDVGLINYLEFAICTVRIDEYPWFGEIGYVGGTIFLLLFVVFSFFVMTRWFILPNLLTVYNWWSINGYQYGILIASTLIVLPNLFKIPVACNAPKQSFSLYFTDLASRTFTMYGFGLALMGINNFLIPPYPFIVNLIMILAGHIYVIILIHFKIKNNFLPKEEQVDFKLGWHAKFLIVVYLIYIFAHLYDPFKAAKLKQGLTPHQSVHSPTDSFVADQPDSNRSTLNQMTSSPSRIESAIALESVLEGVETKLATIENVSLWKAHLRAFYGEVFGEKYIALNIIFAPIWIAMTLLIPVLTEDRSLDGWYKYLLCINLLMLPTLLFGYAKLLIVLIFYVIGLVAATSLLISTEAAAPPRYYKIFSIIGLLAAFIIWNLFEMETGTMIHQCLQYAGGWNIDAATIIGSSFFSCVAEMTLLYELIKEEKMDIAFGVVTGLAMYNTLGIFPYIVHQSCFEESSPVFITNNNTTVYVFFVLMIIYTFIGVVSLNFELRRGFGIFLFIFCSILFLYLTLSVYEFIHPYGSQHSSMLLYNSLAHAEWA